MPHSVESLRYNKWHSSSSCRPMKTLEILSATSARLYPVNQEGLKPYSKSEKRLYFSKLLTSLTFTSFSKGWVSRAVLFWCRPVSIFLCTRNTDETSQQSGKQDSYRHIFKSSASIYEISGLNFTFEFHLWRIKIGFDIFKQLESYKNLM